MSRKICSISADTRKDTFQWFKIRYSNRLQECGSSQLIKVPYTSTTYKVIGSIFGRFNYGGVEYDANGDIYSAPEAPKIEPEIAQLPSPISIPFADGVSSLAGTGGSVGATVDEDILESKDTEPTPPTQKASFPILLLFALLLISAILYKVLRR